MNLLEVQNICKTYGTGETAVQALKDVSFSVPKGEFVAVVGASGSGKSTLLNMIGALDNPTSGKVLIDGKDIFSTKDEELTIFRRRNIGFIFQSYNLIPELNVEQNIIFPLLLDYKKPDKNYLEEILTSLNLQERRHHLPRQLSGGQQQRVAIGRALITRPMLILADEPTGNLDTQNSDEVIAQLKKSVAPLRADNHYDYAQPEHREQRRQSSSSFGRSAHGFWEGGRMKSYLSFIPISAKVRKRQNRMVRICIVLAVFLVTGVFSLADMGVKMEKLNMIKKHGNYHVTVGNIDDATAKKIRADKSVASFSWYSGLNTKLEDDFFIGRKKAALLGVEKSFVNDIMLSENEGRFPKNENEAMLSSNAKELLGVAVGDEITLNTPSGNLQFTVSGFKNYESADFYDIVVAFLDKDGFTRALDFTNGKPTDAEYYIQFRQRKNAKQHLEKLKEKYFTADTIISENKGVMGLEGSSADGAFHVLYFIAEFLVVLVLVAGVLMISSSMNSTVAERTKFFGMLRCTGASKKQVIRIVRLEAVNWCKSAVPIGVAFGIIFTWAICILLRFGIGGEFDTIPIFSFSISGIACGVSVGLVTVLIAAESPARRAASVSPIAAVSGNAYSEIGVQHNASIRLGKIETSLGIHHAISAKKNLFLMTLSFGISIVLFLSFSAFVGFINYAALLRPYTPDIVVVGDEYTPLINSELQDELYAQNGVSNIFGNMLALHFPATAEKGIEEISLISYESYMMKYSRKAVVSGDISKITSGGNYVMSIFRNENPLEVGDKIFVNGKELEIACLISDGIYDGFETPIICTEEIFTQITGETNYTILNIKLVKTATKNDVTMLRNIVSSHDTDGKILFTDHRETNRQNQSTYWLFYILVYGFLSLIAAITIVNIMNSISMSVSGKIKQYGTMRALGMDGVQVAKMISAEAVTYAICGSVIGIALGLLINKKIFETMVTEHFGTLWNVPVLPLVIVTLLVVFACVVAVHAPTKRIRSMAITETINEL